MLLPIWLGKHVYSIMRDYFFDNPETFSHELRTTGIDPLRHPETFIQYELMTQPKHADIRRLVESNDGVVGLEEIHMWIEENKEEIADYQSSHGFHTRMSYPPSEFYTGNILLSDEAEEQLLDFFMEHPQQRLYELDEHKVDPLMQPNVFFRSEITTEAWHSNILDRVKLVNGRVTPDTVNMWIAEEVSMGK